MLRVTKEQFVIPDDFCLDEFMKHSFKVWQDELHTVKIRISPQWSRWVGEKIWHESQKLRKLENGGLELTFRVAGLEEIRMWAMSLGPEAEVIAPPELRNIIRDNLTRAVDLYQGESEKPGQHTVRRERLLQAAVKPTTPGEKA